MYRDVFFSVTRGLTIREWPNYLQMFLLLSKKEFLINDCSGECRVLNTFSGVSICGGYFKDTRKFILFDKPEQKVAIIYGKNGSGKSSIAKAFDEYKENQLIQFSNVSLLDFNNKVVSIQDDHKKYIFESFA